MTKRGEELEKLIRKIVREEIEHTSPAQPEKLFYTEKEFCKLVGITHTTAWRLRKSGKLRYSEIGRAIVYLPEHLTEYLKQHERNIK